MHAEGLLAISAAFLTTNGLLLADVFMEHGQPHATLGTIACLVAGMIAWIVRSARLPPTRPAPAGRSA